MIKIKKLTNYILLSGFLLLAILILAIFIIALLSAFGPSRYTRGIFKISSNSQAEHYYSPQAYRLPPGLAAGAENLMNNTKNISTSTIDLPILLYHYLEPMKPRDRLRDSLTVTPEKFSEQLSLIKQSAWQTVFMSQVAARLNGPATEKKQIALTFDDGYRDFYKYAFPLLKQYNLKATIYIIYDAINSPDYLTEAMIKEMLKSGLVEIGSHTLDHKKLTLLDRAQAERQISLSKRMLEERFKIPMITFAYPFGSFNQELVDLVKAAGFKAAVTVVAGDKQSEVNRFYLSRWRSTDKDGGTLIKRLLNN